MIAPILPERNISQAEEEPGLRLGFQPVPVKTPIWVLCKSHLTKMTPGSSFAASGRASFFKLCDIRHRIPQSDPS
jgi:hypothetical protein